MMTPDRLPPEKPGPENQRDVQRLLGRCMLRIQQYENALKTLLAHHEASGTVEEIKAQPAIRSEKLSGQTLGQLANLLFESFVVPEGFESDLQPEGKTPTDRVLFAHSVRMTLEPDQWQETKAAVQQLVGAVSITRPAAYHRTRPSRCGMGSPRITGRTRSQRLLLAMQLAAQGDGT